ncbi:MAG: hypothetical protein JWR19_3590, partial [Pedosphaera sp.]|nr:hypothetical protein [Pedosphaera sp.]
AKAGTTTAISIEAMFYINSLKAYSHGNANMFGLNKAWTTQFGLYQGIWDLNPMVNGSLGVPVISPATMAANLKVGHWQHLKISLDGSGYKIYIDGLMVSQTNSLNLLSWGGSGPVLLEAGNFDGWLDEIVIKSISDLASEPPPSNLIQGTNFQNSSFTFDANTIALYELNNNFADTTGRNTNLTTAGVARLDSANISWLVNPSGTALRVFDIHDQATVKLTNVEMYKPTQTQAIAVDAMLFVNRYMSYGRESVPLLQLSKNSGAQLILNQLYWDTSPAFIGGSQLAASSLNLVPFLQTNCWQKLSLLLDLNAYSVRVNDIEVARFSSGDITNWAGVGNLTLTFGNFDGWVDEVVVHSSGISLTKPSPPKIAQPIMGSNVFKFYFTAQAGQGYIIQSALTPLATDVWTAITNIPPSATTTNVLVTDIITGSRRFYRVLAQAYVPPPKIDRADTSGSQLKLYFTAQTGHYYVVEYCDNLSPTNTWTTLTNIAPPTVAVNLVIADTVPGPQRFYRLRMQ